MPTRILPEPRYTGSFLPFGIFLPPTHGTAVLYTRLSGASQSCNGKAAEKANAFVQDFRRLAPNWEIVDVVHGVEGGKLSGERRYLRTAVEKAIKHEAFVIAPVLSRALRSASYDRRTNVDAWPTTDEFEAFHEFTKHVTFMTVIPPDASESEQHSYLTKRTGKAGRPSAIDCALGMAVLAAVGVNLSYGTGRRRWERSLADVAEQFGMKKACVQRLLESPIPDGSGRQWLDCPYPFAEYRQTWEKMGRPPHFERRVARID